MAGRKNGADLAWPNSLILGADLLDAIVVHRNPVDVIDPLAIFEGL